MDIWEVALELVKPLADLTYQGFYEKDGQFRPAELIKTLAALVALIGAVYGLYKTAVLSIKGLEKVVHDYIERHSKAVVTKRKKLSKKINLSSGGKKSISNLDVAKLFDESIRLYDSKQVHRAEGVLRELVFHLNKKRDAAVKHLGMTNEELVSAYLMSAELCCAQDDPTGALRYVEDAKAVREHDPDIYIYLGRVHLRNKMSVPALQAFAQAVNFSGEQSLEKTKINALRYESQAHLMNNAPGLAYTSINNAITMASNSAGNEPEWLAQLLFEGAKTADARGYGGVRDDWLSKAKDHARLASADNLSKEINDFAQSLLPRNPPNVVPTVVLGAQN